MNIPKTKICKACGKEFVPGLYKQSAQYCPDPECQKKKLQRPRSHRRNKKPVSKNGNPGFHKRGYKKTSDRVCRKCGRDPYPNYFYCPVCHKNISPDDEYDDLSQSI